MSFFHSLKIILPLTIVLVLILSRATAAQGLVHSSDVAEAGGVHRNPIDPTDPAQSGDHGSTAVADQDGTVETTSSSHSISSAATTSEQSVGHAGDPQTQQGTSHSPIELPASGAFAIAFPTAVGLLVTLHTLYRRQRHYLMSLVRHL